MALGLLHVLLAEVAVTHSCLVLLRFFEYCVKRKVDAEMLSRDVGFFAGNNGIYKPRWSP
jgi:hypothetical protein